MLVLLTPVSRGWMIQLMTRSLLFVAAVVLSTAGLAAGSVAWTGYGPSNLARIVDPKPTFDGWSFRRGDPYIYPVPAHDPAFTVREWLLADSPDKKDRAMAAKLTKAGFWVGRNLVWQGNPGPGRADANAVVFAFLFRSVSGAEIASKLLRFPGSVPIKGFGSDAWAATDGKTGAVLTWRRGNLIVHVAIDCDDTDCGFPPMQPGRAYAAEIDRRANLHH